MSIPAMRHREATCNGSPSPPPAPIPVSVCVRTRERRRASTRIPIVAVGLDASDAVHHRQAAADAPENGVLAVQVGRGRKSDEELAPVRVGPAVGHGQNAGACVLQLGRNLVRKLVTVRAHVGKHTGGPPWSVPPVAYACAIRHGSSATPVDRSTAAAGRGWITRLNHKILGKRGRGGSSDRCNEDVVAVSASLQVAEHDAGRGGGGRQSGEVARTRITRWNLQEL